ncbi:efflux RND transporter periplasmic adaptor subunit [Oceanicoccus sp. KOV_DT_Chl]|uniref:efflux RND transporter periplasmic adaptor subunit n=1 Tax=Oceanicoccus sp. KOV_DT_Chl TaxID=1904639 RepID=UPI00135B613D|nr:efflux RND transporter periplasmic adaptor subunit [Oceanicoccus sp. KOV_DT_Chl]
MNVIKRTWITPLLMIVVATAIAVLLVMNRPDNAKVEQQVRSLSVDVAEVSLQSLRIPIQAQGSVSPHRETAIVAEVAGKIIEVSPSFYAGGYVSKGDVLLRIDDVDHQANVFRAQAAVASAESQLAQEQGRADVAAQELKKVPNKHRSESARALYLRQPQLKQAQAELLSAQASLTKARHDLKRTVIRAPYDSLIKEKQSDLGLYLSPGSPIAVLYAIDFAEIRLAIPQSKLSYLELPTLKDSLDPLEEYSNTRVDLYTSTGDDPEHWQASLHRTEGVYDERSRVLFAVARVKDPYLLNSPVLNNAEAITAAQNKAPLTPLRMGTFVSAAIEGRLIDNLVVLPRNVLRAGDFLWVVDQQNKLSNRKVSTLRIQGNKIYVTKGLENGDRVCLTPIGDAIAGSTVIINSMVNSSELFNDQTSIPEAVTEQPLPAQATDTAFATGTAP